MNMRGQSTWCSKVIHLQSRTFYRLQWKDCRLLLHSVSTSDIIDVLYVAIDWAIQLTKSMAQIGGIKPFATPLLRKSSMLRLPASPRSTVQSLTYMPTNVSA